LLKTKKTGYCLSKSVPREVLRPWRPTGKVFLGEGKKKVESPCSRPMAFLSLYGNHVLAH
jgi:hypothetical protein